MRLRPLCLSLVFAIAGPLQLLAWQQRVHYSMEIVMHVESHSYDGKQQLVYVNNSPDTLRHIYYHLFFEAFKPGSMMDRHDRSLPHGGVLRIGELPPEWQGSVRVESLKQEGSPLTWKIDETILDAALAQPLAPGDSTTLEMTWKTRIPRLTRRGGWMNSEGVEYSMSQWYPKLAEYDAAGWHADEYVQREFYGVYGTFDVALTLPATYVVGGSGRVVNPEEVGCGYELGAVDTLITSPASGTGMKTWRFHAENVHDFAWVADQEYAHQIARWNDVTIHLLYKRSATALWAGASTWIRELLSYYSSRFGAYSWRQFTVAMAGDGGMEYPQLIMVTGYRGASSLLNVIAHETGHQWFYAMVGNNETQEAWLDEGFTQYLTTEAERKLFNLGFNPYEGLEKIVYPWVGSSWTDARSYYQLAIAGYDEPLDTYHDWFREDLTSGLVYYKGMAVVRMMQYMFGDSLFDEAMRHYVDKWRYRHPTTRDLEQAVEEASGMKLDWFFNEWINSTKLCDYAIDALSSEPSAKGYATTITLSNRNEIVMPLDIILTYDDGSKAMANVPVEEWRKPEVEFHLPRWEWVMRDYSTTFITPKRVVRAEIDSSMLLFDIDRTNNIARTGFPESILPASHVAWYRRWDLNRPMDRYSIRLRPALWYSQADGVQLGLVADGGYAFDRYNSKAGIYYNFGSKRVDYDLRYDTPIGLLGRLTKISLIGTNADGVERWGVALTKNIRPYYWDTPYTLDVGLSANHSRLIGENYPNAVAPWSSGSYNTIGVWGSIGSYSGSLHGSISTHFDAGFASASEFAQWRLRADGGLRLWGLDVGGDFFFGTSTGEPPAQLRFNAAGASSVTMHDNVVQRLAMNIRPEFAARNHLVLPGEGYLLAFAGNDSARFGKHLLNMRITVGDLNPFNRFLRVPFLKEFDLGLYGAGGWIFDRSARFSDLEDINLEAGAEVSIDLLRTFLPNVLVNALDSPAPLRLSFYLPFYAHSKLLPAEGFAYRYAIGVSM